MYPGRKEEDNKRCMTDEPLWQQARALRDALRQELARDAYWRVWSIEPVRLDDDRVVPMVLVEERQNGTFHLVPTREEWMKVQAGQRRGFRTRN
jgi:hypothetical protein